MIKMFLTGAISVMEISIQISKFVVHTHMLTLDHTTLFYFSLRDHLSKLKDNNVGLEQYMDWAMNIPKNAKPLSMDVPSLTNGSTLQSHLPPSTWSALTNNVRITQYDGDIEIVDHGFPNQDKTRGSEREATIKSPPKGKQCILSLVCHQLRYCTFIYYPTGSHTGQRLTK